MALRRRAAQWLGETTADNIPVWSCPVLGAEWERRPATKFSYGQTP